MSKLTVIIPVAPNRKLQALPSLKPQKNIFTIIQKGTNPSKNRNLGAQKAKTPLIAFINAHSILQKNWSEIIIEFFEKHPEIDIVGGPQLNHPQESLFGKVSGHALSSIFGAAEASTRYKPTKVTLNANESHLTSANLACRKSVFQKIKFNENIYPGEDPKFISDAKKTGLNVAYSPDIQVYHIRRPNTRSLTKQIFNYGITRPQKESFFETLKKPQFLVPSFFLIYLILFPLLSLIHYIFLIPLILYILLAIIFSIFEGVKNNHLPSIFLLPFIFFIIHVAYGIGFIYGSLSSKNRKNENTKS